MPAEDSGSGQRPVAVVGEALMDLVPADGGLFQAAPGGSPANVAVGLARLDVPVYLLARLARDALGGRLRRHLVDNGVDISRAVTATEPCSLAIVALDEQGAARYDFRVTGTADWQWRQEELRGALDGVAALHGGSLALVLPPGADVLVRLFSAARAHLTVSYDPNCRPLLMGDPQGVRARVEELVGLVDVVKASEEDIDWLYPGVPAAEVLANWIRRGPAVVAITLGAAGVIAAMVGSDRRTDAIRMPAPVVVVADTVGAGDAFMAGLLSGLHNRDLLGAERRALLRSLSRAALSEVLQEALSVAALTCTRRGADPPTRTELRGFSSSFRPIGG